MEIGYKRRPWTLAATAAIALAAACALSACGGSGGDDNSSSGGGNSGGGNTGGGGNSGGGTATPPSASQAATICSGTGSSTPFDVYLPTALGITRDARATEVFGGTGAEQCIAVAASATQDDGAAFKAVTSDAWSDAISYFDPDGTGVSGGIRLEQKLFVTCQPDSDVIKHLAVLASGRVTSDASTTVARNVGFTSYECLQDTSGVHAGSGSTVATFGSDGSLTVKESGTTVLNVAAADVPALFSDTGYDSDGDVMRWQLYQLDTGTGSKQVIVHTMQKAGGGYGVIAFVQP